MNFLKKQWVAWVITAVMILGALVIGRIKAVPEENENYDEVPVVLAGPPVAEIPSEEAKMYIIDEADVLSPETGKALADRNNRLISSMNTAIAVVTCNDVDGDLRYHALNRAGGMRMGENDFIVVMDISGKSFQLVQGSALDSGGKFTDDDCADYAARYIKEAFDKGDYDGAALSIFEALESWYQANK